MRTSLHPRRFAAAAALLMLVGCFKLSRDTPQVQYFVLSGTPAPSGGTGTSPSSSASKTPEGARLAIGVRRIDIASYLSVPAIVMRRGANQLVVSEFHRWGEDIGEGINRVVAAQLASAPQVRSVDVAPWAARARHDFLVQLHVSRFEGMADSAATEGRSHLVAGWDIIRPLDGTVMVRGTTEALEGPWRVSDYAGLVTGLDAALARLARDIGRCLSAFPNDSTPPARCESSAGESPGNS